MQPIHLCVMQPAGHVHALAFLEPARYLRWQLRRRGATVTLAKNRLREDSLNIVFGAHLGFPREWAERHACVFFNLEQLGAGGATLDAAYLELLRSSAVVDYDAANVEAYAHAAADVPLLPLLHAPYLDTPGALPLEQRPIDLLFVGTMNPRRRALIERIEAAGVGVATFDHPVYGPERDAFVRQTKAVLNCAYYDTSRFEQVRVAHALLLGTPVISLRPSAPLPHAAFEQGVCWLDEADVDSFFRERFATPTFFDDARARLAAWRTHDASDAYAELLAFATGVFQGHARSKPAGAWQPPYLNLGSGKDYKPGWLNLDILERAEPDLVLDLGRAQTFPIETTTRFGAALQLEAGSVQAIVANNVLEHVPDLPTLMGNALALLAEGGLFEIEVPYEKAPTAWQDPTHLRALNEQSWLYYTDWFWYLGWFEHRFEIVRSAWLDASGVRECAQDGAQFMRVTLRKIATTPHERTVARAWQPDFGGLPEDDDDGADDATVKIAFDGTHALGVAAAHYQRLMDEGRMPHLVRATADRLVVHTRAVFADAGDARSLRGRVAVVVPCTRQHQFEANVQRSPGLIEFDARIVQVWDAASPADAVAQALPHCDGAQWILLCHQDVYFAKGFGAHLAAVLDDIAPAQRRHALIGFAGLGVDEHSGVASPAGFVIDRLHRFDHDATLRAVSLDELAVVFAADSVHRIDAALGWHLWATDLCLVSITQHRTFPRIVRAPLFHNSDNDHTLPDAFHASARVLAEKHATWGPIATLCGTVEAAPAASPLALAFDDGHVDDAHALHLPAAEAALARLADDGALNAALALTLRAVHQTYRRGEFAHRALYYPGLDAQLARLALPHAEHAACGGGTLIVATELYAIGGHSRVLEDLAREVERPLVVLTDLFDTLQADAAALQSLRERLHPVAVEVLAPGSFEDKACALAARAAAFGPARIVHFGHHQDPLPLVALLRHPATQWFVHHADHNPGLGPTLPGLRHIDCTASLRDTCAHHLARPALRLPLHVADRGVARWTKPVRGRDFSVATSGQAAKFARDGTLALQAIVRSALASIDGRFFHIGPLDDAWRDEIRAHLAVHGIAPERFVALGSVPSVWQALKECGAAFYIGSAPVSGGRAAVEAQGCGLPVLCFTGFAEGSLLADFSSYADLALGWRDVDGLARLLGSVGKRHAASSAQARTFYEREFSHARLRAAVRALMGDEGDEGDDAIEADEKPGNPAAVPALV